MKFQLMVKEGPRVIADVTGKSVSTDNISVGDGQKTIEIEQLLEKLFGYRFHIMVASYEEELKNDSGKS